MKRLVAILIAIVLANTSQAATWYVSNRGNDRNAGTSNAPLQHVQAGVKKAAYGDTVNIQAGVYREQVFLAKKPAGTGGWANMLTIRAWDTNGDGIIEPNEIPTINAFQLITNGWVSVGSGATWNLLTAGAPFQANTIFSNAWSPNAGTNYPLNHVMQSYTNHLTQALWPFSNSCDHPLFEPAAMTAGTFCFDYTNHVLYVWRSDGLAPGPAAVIEAPLLNSNLVNGGGSGPFIFEVPWIHLRYLNCLYENNIDYGSNLEGGGPVIGFNSASNIVEHCTAAWAAALGGFSPFGSTVWSNNTFCFNGCCALDIAGTNTIIWGNGFSSNQWLRMSGGCTSEGTIYVIGGQAASGDEIISNLFYNNLGSAIHFDTTTASSSSPSLVGNNLIYGTNNLGLCNCGFDRSAGVDLEVSSGVVIYNNIFNLSAGPVNVDGGSHNQVLFNTVCGQDSITLQPEPARVPGYTATNNLVACNLTVVNTAHPSPVIGGASDSTSAGWCVSNAWVNNISWNLSQTSYGNVLRPPYTTGLTQYTNGASWQAGMAGTDYPSLNSGNLFANGNIITLGGGTNALLYMTQVGSPARGYSMQNFGVTCDFFGRPRGAVTDVGAIQGSTP